MRYIPQTWKEKIKFLYDLLAGRATLKRELTTFEDWLKYTSNTEEREPSEEIIFGAGPFLDFIEKIVKQEWDNDIVKFSP